MSKSKHGFWWWMLIGWWWWPCRALVYDIPLLIIRGVKSLIGKADRPPKKRGGTDNNAQGGTCGRGACGD